MDTYHHIHRLGTSKMKLAILAVVLVALAARPCSAVPLGLKAALEGKVKLIQTKIAGLQKELQNDRSRDFLNWWSNNHARCTTEIFDILGREYIAAAEKSPELSYKTLEAIEAYVKYAYEIKEILQDYIDSIRKEWEKFSNKLQASLTSFSDNLSRIIDSPPPPRRN